MGAPVSYAPIGVGYGTYDRLSDRRLMGAPVSYAPIGVGYGAYDR
jgi:hypothetical protein